MQLIRTALVFGLLSACSAPLFAKSKPLTPSVDTDYVLALAIADRFLHARQTQDEEAGILLLSDRVRQRTQEDQVDRFFLVLHRRAFWLRNRARQKTRLRPLPVSYRSLIALVPERAQVDAPLSSVLIVDRSGKRDWAVDKLPAP